MNIFVLNLDTTQAAQDHLDKHVVKMTLESTQLLSSAIHLNGGIGPYKLTHKGHPCTLWAAKNKSNWNWLKRLGLALAVEYTYRYDKIHKCQDIICCMDDSALKDGDMTPFAMAMPDEYKSDDIVASYRKYYLREKHDIAVWTKREPPSWWDKSFV